MKALGVLDLETEIAGCRFSIGLRNSRQEHAFGDDVWVSRIRLLEYGVRGGVYASARETLEVFLADRLYLG